MSHPTTLARRLGLADATTIGVGSMVGAGVFAVFAPAARVAGAALLVGLLLAAVVAFCNATSSAQLAAVHPVAGGSYAYGRAELGPWSGFAAGWSFIIGKTASCAAMALTFAAYLVPDGWAQRLVAVAAVLALAAINYRGITRTALATRLIVAVVVTVLMVWTASNLAIDGPRHLAGLSIEPTILGTLQAAGLLFFAFAGYARIATMGEEVRDPGRTIPRAIIAALAIALTIFVAVALTLLDRLGPDALAASTRPVLDAARAIDPSGALGVAVGAAAALACLGALLNLMTGIGRTSLAMARERDLPTWFAGIHPRFQVPHRAEVALAVAVSVLVLFGGLREVISFSSFGVLLYYTVANAAALRQREGRRYPRVLQVLGIVLCLALVATLTWKVLVTGVVVLAVGLLGRAAVLHRRARS
ncbi:amino acid permease [Tessaracoccus sp. SD287]|uniref:APC family permease n=1 Tax=Tessaracoccus sp. SD287 TaxID=2782008 RepID=UPI001DC976CF|nr:amino acid permease [Tessaracoccus sp. SD287]